jgi:hypothetical protein
MSHWNYRVLRKVHNGEEYFSIHEVFYDKNNNPNACSVEPVSAHGDTVWELKKDLELMIQALDKQVLDYDFFEKLSKEKN